MKYFINKDDIYSKLTLVNLKLLILCTSLFAYKYVYSFRMNQETSLKLFTILLFVIWTMKILINNNIFFKKTRLNFPILLFVLLMSVSLLRSQFFMVSLNDYIIFLFYFFIYFLIINNINDKAQFNSLIKLIFIISIIIAIYAIMQYYGFDPFLKELSAITSTMGQKNWISNYLALIFPIVFSYFLLEKIKKNKIIYYLLLSILYTTLMICQSRGIWISISITTILAIYIIFKFKLVNTFQENKKWLTLLLVTFLMITIIYSTDNPLNKSAITVPQRALSTFDEQDPSINTRLLMWRTTFEMIKDKPIFGSGIGTFKMNYLNYQAKFFKVNPDYIKYLAYAREAHNEYLQIGAELGIVGLGIFILIIFVFYNLILKYVKKESRDNEKIIVFGLLMGVTSFLIHSLFTFPLHVPALGLTFFIVIGLTLSYIRNIGSLKHEKNIIIKNEIFKNKKIKIFCIILFLFFMIFAIDSLVIKPYLAEIYYFKGMRYNNIKNYDMSFPYLKYAAQLNPYNGRILHALGSTYYNINIFDKAEEILQKAKKYIIDANTFYMLGLVYSKRGLNKEAEEELKQAIYLNLRFSEAYYNLGLLYFSQENYDDTIEQWNKILEIEPNFPNEYIVLNNLGIVYQKKEMPDKALEYFLEALALAPEGSPIIEEISPIIEEIEEEIYIIYKSKLRN